MYTYTVRIMEERKVLSYGGTFTKNAFKTLLKTSKVRYDFFSREMYFAVFAPKMTVFSDTWQEHGT